MIFTNLRLRCYQTRTYWRLRAQVQTVVHWRRTRSHVIRQSVRSQKKTLKSLIKILGIATKLFLFAAGVAVLVQFVDSLFVSKFSWSVPSDRDYVAFLATVSGVGGVFIGLYYAGISAVGSAIYSTVPNNVRDLLAEEQFGNVYMQFLAVLTVVCLFFVALRLMNVPRNTLLIPLVAVSAGIGVIAFVQLGRRAFYFFDPTKLASSIFERLQRCLDSVSVGGFQWSHRAFQKHAQHRALQSLNTLRTLTDITAKEPHLSGKPFIELTQILVKFLRVYEQLKRKVPTDSLWYEEQYQHRDWYLTDYSEIAIAHQTGTFLKPTISTNKEWVEEMVLPILERCVVANLKSKSYNDLMGLFSTFDHYFRDLARSAEVQRALKVLEALSSVVLNETVVSCNDEIVINEELEKIAIVERVATLSISLILGFRESLTDGSEHVSGDSFLDTF